MLPPISAAALAEFSEVSGDRNPIHLDGAAARAAGLPGVIAHGMFVMTQMNNLLTAEFPAATVHRLRTRFLVPVPIGTVLTISGRLTPGSGATARVTLSASRDDGLLAARGQAELHLFS